MSKRIVGIVGSLLVMASLVVGCGGGVDTTDETVTLTKVEFIRQGDAICERARQKKVAGLKAALTKLAADGASAFTTRYQIQLLNEVIMPPYEQMTDELAALEGPEDAKAAAVPKSFERVIGKLQANPEIITTERNVFVVADEAADAYGFKVCKEIY